jgi:hypothetical protein
MRIRLGVPNIIIYAISNASQSIASRPKKPIEPGTVFRRLYFLRITAAYGGKGIGGYQSGFQGGSCAFEHEVIFVGRLAETQPPQVIGIKRPLVSEIVNRK